MVRRRSSLYITRHAHVSLWFVCNLVFFQAEDGIRDRDVTGVQTWALPISASQRSFAALEATSRGTKFPKAGYLLSK